MGRSGRSGGGGSRSGGGRSGGSRMSSGRSASRSFSSSHSSGWSRSGSSGSFGSIRPTANRPTVGRSVTSSPSGSFTSHKPAVGVPNATRHKTGVPTGSYRNRRPIYTGSPLGGGMFSGGMFGSGNVIINVDNHQETYTDTGAGTANDSGQQPQSTVQQTSSSTGADNRTLYNDTGTVQSTKKKSGGFSTVIVIAIWLLVVYVLFSFVGGFSGGNENYVTKSTVNREKLHLGLSDEAGYFTDECNWIRNRTVLENGLKNFYDSTGILPYVYIIDNVAGDYDPSTEKLEQFAEACYGQLFDDEGHALLVFWDYAGAYEYILWLGEDAAELMDTEACDILFDYLDYYYYYADTEEEFFADTFADAGERMMSVTRSPIYYIIIVVIGAGVGVLIYRVQKSHKEKEAARKKRAEEILNSPLEKFGTNGDVIDELEKKYEKEI